jgi:GDP-4-dehydro-6-deoxy-D-mannose reductase
MKRALITGISGFAGSFLAEYLCKKGGYEVVGTYHAGKRLDNLQPIRNDLTLIQADLTDKKAIQQLISDAQPDIVFHLAALASPSESFKDPSLTFATNVVGQINLLEAIREQRLADTRILIVSSSEVYGIVGKEDLPIDEDTPFRPVSPYAVSKITQDFLGLQYYLTYKLQVIRVRPFNHIGPRQTPQYAVASFARQIALIEKGKQDATLLVGNLNARRDFTDVRDIVRAYVEILERGDPGDVYNIGSGVSHTMSEIVGMLIKFAKVPINLVQDEKRFMPIDIPDNQCDSTKLRRKISWQAEIPLDVSLRDVLDYWRKIA